MTLNWQPFGTMPICRDVFVFSDDGGIDVASKSVRDPSIPNSYCYSPSHVGGHDMDWDFDGWGSTSSIIAWAEIPDDKPSWYVPKPPPVPMTDEERTEVMARGYAKPSIFSRILDFYGSDGKVVRVVADDLPFDRLTIGDTLKIKKPDLR